MDGKMVPVTERLCPSAERYESHLYCGETLREERHVVHFKWLFLLLWLVNITDLVIKCKDTKNQVFLSVSQTHSKT